MKYFKIIIFLILIISLFWIKSFAYEIISEEFSEKIEFFEVFPESLVKNLPSDIDSQVVYFLNYFSTEKKEVIQRWLKRGEKFLPYFKAIYREYGLPEDLVYLSLIESGCNPFAVSRAGAVGIWQFIESTAKLYGLKINYWIDERKDFIKSTHASAKYLKKLYEIFGDWRIAVASYNAGEGRLNRVLKVKNYIDYWKIVNSGLLPYETVAYLPQWLAITLIVKNPTKYGFQPLKETPLDFEEIKVPGGIDLKVFALAGEIDYEELLLLNAELRRHITPPESFYTLKVPYGTKNLIEKNFSKIPTVVLKKDTPLGSYRIITLVYDKEKKTFLEETKTANLKSQNTSKILKSKTSKNSKKIKIIKKNKKK